MNKKCLIIAELSANHGGDIEVAKETIRAAKRSGADAIKMQTYKSSTMTLDCRNDDFKVQGGTLWDNRYLYRWGKKANYVKSMLCNLYLYLSSFYISISIQKDVQNNIFTFLGFEDCIWIKFLLANTVV